VAACRVLLCGFFCSILRRGTEVRPRKEKNVGRRESGKGARVQRHGQTESDEEIKRKLERRTG